MGKEAPRILVVDTEGTIGPILSQLRARTHYEFTYTEDLHAVRSLLRWEPVLVLLHVPEEKRAAVEAFDCLDALRDQLPVVVTSTAADMGLYLVAMTRGAFDYFTSYTPLDEILQILSGAIRWQRTQAA